MNYPLLHLTTKRVTRFAFLPIRVSDPLTSRWIWLRSYTAEYRYHTAPSIAYRRGWNLVRRYTL